MLFVLYQITWCILNWTEPFFVLDRSAWTAWASGRNRTWRATRTNGSTRQRWANRNARFTRSYGTTRYSWPRTSYSTLMLIIVPEAVNGWITLDILRLILTAPNSCWILTFISWIFDMTLTCHQFTKVSCKTIWQVKNMEICLAVHTSDH